MTQLISRRHLLLAAAAAPLGAAHAADWSPTRPIEMLVSFPAGGTADAIARLLATELSQSRGWTCISVNKAGGAGVVMQRALAAARGDGQTLGICASYQLVYTPEGMSAPPYGVNGFRQLASVASSPMCVVAKADAPFKTLEQLKAHAAAHGRLSMGVSAPFNWLGERLGADLGINIVSVPYKGSGELLPALLGGHIDLSLSSGGHIPHERNGSLRVLAALTHDRLPGNPNIPTMREQGGKTLIESRFVLMGPKGMRDDAADTIIRSVQATVNGATFQQKLSNSLGLVPAFMGPPLLNERLRLEETAAHAQESGTKPRG